MSINFASMYMNKAIFVYRSTDTAPYIQVDFQEPKFLSGLITQGEGAEQRWVTSFQLFTSLDGVDFTPYSEKQDGVTKTFIANTDTSTAVTNYFVKNIITRYLRIVPTSSNIGVALR